MSDFDDLQQIREAKENAEVLAHQRKLEEERRQADAAKRLEDQMVGYAQSLDDMVTSVLEELRQAVYPLKSVRRLKRGPVDQFRATWGIVWEYDAGLEVFLLAL